MSSDTRHRSFRAACVQFDVRRGEVDANLAAAERGLRDAAAEGAQLAVMPEMWTTSFVPDASDALLAASLRAEARIAELSSTLGLTIIGSAPEPDDGQVFNRAVVWERGKSIGAYRKIHLFSPNNEHKHHAPGHEPLIVNSALGRIGVVICYDLRFPELIRFYFYARADVLAVPAQWPEARADHWRILLKARAIENEMFVVGCNRIGFESSLKSDEQLVFPGDSRIVDPMGQVVAEGAGADNPIVAELDMKRVRVMRRILPVAKDRRPDLYARMWNRPWTEPRRAD